MTQTTGFPQREFGALVRRLPAYARLAWALGRDPRLSRARRLAVLAGAAYVASPVDLIPGFIPLAGQLDDLLVGLGAIRFALDGLKPEWRAERLATVGLTQADLDADFRTTEHVGRWMVGKGARIGRRVVTRGAEVGLDVGGRLARGGLGVARRVRRRVGV